MGRVNNQDNMQSGLKKNPRKHQETEIIKLEESTRSQKPTFTFSPSIPIPESLGKYKNQDRARKGYILQYKLEYLPQAQDDSLTQLCCIK